MARRSQTYWPQLFVGCFILVLRVLIIASFVVSDVGVAFALTTSIIQIVQVLLLFVLRDGALLSIKATRVRAAEEEACQAARTAAAAEASATTGAARYGSDEEEDERDTAASPQRHGSLRPTEGSQAQPADNSTAVTVYNPADDGLAGNRDADARRRCSRVNCATRNSYGSTDNAQDSSSPGILESLLLLYVTSGAAAAHWCFMLLYEVAITIALVSVV